MKISVCILLISVSFFNVSGQQTLYNVTPGQGNGLRFWNNDAYKIHMGNSTEYKYGPVNDYSIKMNMNNDTDRGWVWGVTGVQPIAALNTLGDFQIDGSFRSKLGIFEAADIQVAANASDYKDWAKYSVAIAAGKVLETQSNGHQIRKFEFSDFPQGNTLPAGTSLTIKNDNNKTFFTTSSINAETRFHVADPEGVEIIKAGNFATNSSNNNSNESVNWVHLLKPNSRFAIGSWAMYKPEHEFTVRGSGWFEHEIITNDKIGVGIQASDIPTGYKLVKVQLQNSWPDYVFHKAYDLPTIQEVAHHISEKGHLINIPSAAEVKENGIQLGEMNAKLLEKIEELTLYTIAQEKKINELQSDNKKQQSIIHQQLTNNQQIESRLAKLEALLTKK